MVKTILLSLATLFIYRADGQTNPVKWTFTATKVADKTYEVTLKANVSPSWHICSQTTPDGGPVATRITFNKSPLLSITGKTKELGKVITRYEEVFNVDVIYFEGEGKFVQTVKIKASAKTKLSGVVEYMVCNDQQCLPPTELPFTIDIK